MSRLKLSPSELHGPLELPYRDVGPVSTPTRTVDEAIDADAGFPSRVADLDAVAARATQAFRELAAEFGIPLADVPDSSAPIVASRAKKSRTSDPTLVEVA